jgi:2-polyprenyl-3-methyl-5-hydroxy-6-metoxy-1,4-benzoquinol methylase
MIAADVRAYVRANLPAPPARVLDVGAGEGDLARSLRVAGYDVLAIDPDPRGDDVRAVALHDLDEPDASFDAAVAVVSLHHVEPLEESCARLGELVRPGGTLVVDELDVGAYDGAAAAWWLAQRAALGATAEKTAGEMVAELRHHLHPLTRMAEALSAGGFEVGAPLRGPYLYRWYLNESLRPAEEDLIARGELPAVGARLVGHRR